MKDWMIELENNVTEEIIKIIVGNKKDKEAIRVVSTDEAKSYAHRNNATYYETSAKTKEGISDMFDDLAMKIHDKEEIINVPNEGSIGLNDLGSIRNKKKKDECC